MAGRFLRAARGTPPGVSAAAWCAHAESENALGRIRRAVESFRRAGEQAAGAGDPGLLGRILVGQVHALAVAGRARESAALFARAERLLAREGNHALLGKLHMNRGNAFYQDDRYRDAYEAYSVAEEAMTRAGIRDAAWVGLLMNRAVAASNLERPEEARKLFLRSEREAAALGQAFLEAFARFNRASLEWARGDYRSALRLLESSGGVFSAQGSADMAASADRTRGEIYLELGMAEEAVELVRGAGDRFRREGMTLDAALCRIDEARGWLLLERPEQARPLLTGALDAIGRGRNRPRRAATLLTLAETEEALGNPGRAHLLASRAIRMFDAQGLASGVHRARIGKARLFLAGNRPGRAEALLSRSLASRSPLPPGIAEEAWALAGRISLARGRAAEARRRLTRAARFLERRQQAIPGAALRARSFERQVAIYDDLISLELSRRRPRPGTLFPLLEGARARGFRRRPAASPASDPRATDERRILLGALTRKLETREFEGSGDTAVLERRILRLEREITRARLRAEEAEEGAAGPEAPPDPDAVAAVLRRDDALIEFHVGPDRAAALVLGPTAREIAVLGAGPGELRRRMERVRFQIEAMALSRTAPNLDFHRRSAERALGDLYDALLRPLEGFLPSRGRLFVVPHRFLHGVPFECLHDGSAYADDRWTVVRVPTAGFLAGRRRRRSRGPALVAGTVRTGPPEVARELQRVSRLLPSGKAVVLLEDAPTAEILDSLERASTVHLASHAALRADNPRFSRLSTADGGLFVLDIEGRRLRADLVVLSACSTGEVVPARGDELSSLAHGFLSAGARSLVAAQWRIDDGAAADWMESFYRHYFASPRRDAAGAFREAGRSVRERRPHPYYWSGFSLHGV